MFKDLRSITVSGGGFPEDRYPGGVKLDLFKYRLNLVYGRNGSGKSTIASAVNDWKRKTAGDVSLTFSPDIPDGCGDSVHVFNEKFIQENILERAKGPKTIMMIGSGNVTAIKRIEEIDKTIAEKNGHVGSLEKIIRDLDDISLPGSLESLLKAASAPLKEDGGFAERATLIKHHTTSLGNRNKSRINEAVISSISGVKSELAIADMPSDVKGLKSFLLTKINMLSSVSGGQQKIFWRNPGIDLGFDLDVIKDLLDQNIVKPELTDREKKIFALLGDSERTDYLLLARKDLLQQDSEYCPLCHQSIGTGVRETLADTVARLLSNEEEAFRQKLDNALGSMTQMDIPLPEFPDRLYEDDIRTCQGFLYVINSIISDTATLLLERKSDPYKAKGISVDWIRLSDNLAEVRKALVKLEKDVIEYNTLVDNNAALEREAELANRYLAYLEANALILNYTRALDTYKKTVTEKDKINEEIGILRAEKRALSLQMKQTAIAHDYINTQLSHIFFSNDRLSLQGSDEGSYVLCSRGKPVPPGRVSTGERNIIALAYFFATLYSGKSMSSMYTDPMLVVIDDPVSSFDYDNRAGISAFLSAEISKILRGCTGSKTLVFTHDLRTVSDLSRLSPVFNGEKAPIFCELTNGSLIPFKGRDNEYWKLLQDIYNYADGSSSGNDDTGIGNKMRRLMDTYSNFMFQCGYKEMMRRDYVCEPIPEEKRDFYRTFLGRFIFDALSHADNQVNTLEFTEALYSPDEKQATARNVLKFLYLTNHNHLRAYLTEDQYNMVGTWAEETV